MFYVSTTGYIIKVIGLYFSDGENNDAQILNHIIQNDIEEFKQWSTTGYIISVFGPYFSDTKNDAQTLNHIIKNE